MKFRRLAYAASVALFISPASAEMTPRQKCVVADIDTNDRSCFEACVLQDYLAILRRNAARLPTWPCWLYEYWYSPINDKDAARACGGYRAARWVVAAQVSAHWGQRYKADFKSIYDELSPDDYSRIALNGNIDSLDQRFASECPPKQVGDFSDGSQRSDHP